MSSHFSVIETLRKLGTYCVQSSNPFIQISLLIFTFFIIKTILNLSSMFKIGLCPIFLTFAYLVTKLIICLNSCSQLSKRLYTQFRCASECNNKTEVKSYFESRKNVENFVFLLLFFIRRHNRGIKSYFLLPIINRYQMDSLKVDKCFGCIKKFFKTGNHDTSNPPHPPQVPPMRPKGSLVYSGGPN